jgi:hypothetical protein
MMTDYGGTNGRTGNDRGESAAGQAFSGRAGQAARRGGGQPEGPAEGGRRRSATGAVEMTAYPWCSEDLAPRSATTAKSLLEEGIGS